MKSVTLKFYSDPSHGWLAVRVKFLEQLGLKIEDFSRYSYRKGSTVYLEEDCDADKFMERLKASYNKAEYTIVEKHTNNRSPIRSYPIIHP
jgi:hypothetical protein